MEGCPKHMMINFDLKEAGPIDEAFEKPLKKYISEFYHENPESYNNEIKLLANLRKNICKIVRDQADGIIALKKYFVQLQYIQSRFPMCEGGEAAVPFLWYDVYSSEAIVYKDIKYEQACLLFNLGGLFSQLATLEKRDTDESMKIACTYFQNSAGAFQYIKDNFSVNDIQDMTEAILSVKIAIVLGQASECLLEKTIREDKNPLLVARISLKVVSYFKEAIKLLESSSTSEMGSSLRKPWIKHLKIKVFCYEAIAYMYMGNDANAQEKYGEKAGYFKVASTKIEEAKKLLKNQNAKVIETVTFISDVVEVKTKNAVHENDHIYHMIIPDAASLKVVDEVTLVKPLPFRVDDPTIAGHDIFSKLIPMKVHESASVYSELKANLLRQITAEVGEKDMQLTESLTAMKLESMLEPTEQTLPDELKSKSEFLRKNPDIFVKVEKDLEELSQISAEVSTKLDEINRKLEEAEISMLKDENTKEKLKIISNEYAECQKANAGACQHNEKLAKFYSDIRESIVFLSGDEKEIFASLPRRNFIDIVQSDEPIVRRMREMLNKVDQMKNQRVTLLTKLRDEINNDDITGQLAVRNQESHDDFFQDQLSKHDERKKIILQNLSAQENILQALIEANANYAVIKQKLDAADDEFNEQAQFYIMKINSFVEMKERIRNGVEFYLGLQKEVKSLSEKLETLTKGKLKPVAKGAPPARPSAKKPDLIGPRNYQHINRATLPPNSSPAQFIMRHPLPSQNSAVRVPLSPNMVAPPFHTNPNQPFLPQQQMQNFRNPVSPHQLRNEQPRFPISRFPHGQDSRMGVHEINRSQQMMPHRPRFENQNHSNPVQTQVRPQSPGQVTFRPDFNSPNQGHVAHGQRPPQPGMTNQHAMARFPQGNPIDPKSTQSQPRHGFPGYSQIRGQRPPMHMNPIPQDHMKSEIRNPIPPFQHPNIPPFQHPSIRSDVRFSRAEQPYQPMPPGIPQTNNTQYPPYHHMQQFQQVQHRLESPNGLRVQQPIDSQHSLIGPGDSIRGVFHNHPRQQNVNLAGQNQFKPVNQYPPPNMVSHVQPASSNTLLSMQPTSRNTLPSMQQTPTNTAPSRHQTPNSGSSALQKKQNLSQYIPQNPTMLQNVSFENFNTTSRPNLVQPNQNILPQSPGNVNIRPFNAPQHSLSNNLPRPLLPEKLNSDLVDMSGLIISPVNAPQLSNDEQSKHAQTMKSQHNNFSSPSFSSNSYPANYTVINQAMSQPSTLASFSETRKPLADSSLGIQIPTAPDISLPTRNIDSHQIRNVNSQPIRNVDSHPIKNINSRPIRNADSVDGPVINRINYPINANQDAFVNNMKNEPQQQVMDLTPYPGPQIPLQRENLSSGMLYSGKPLMSPSRSDPVIDKILKKEDNLKNFEIQQHLHLQQMLLQQQQVISMFQSQQSLQHNEDHQKFLMLQNQVSGLQKVIENLLQTKQSTTPTTEENKNVTKEDLEKIMQTLLESKQFVNNRSNNKIPSDTPDSSVAALSKPLGTVVSDPPGAVITMPSSQTRVNQSAKIASEEELIKPRSPDGNVVLNPPIVATTQIYEPKVDVEIIKQKQNVNSLKADDVIFPRDMEIKLLHKDNNTVCSEEGLANRDFVDRTTSGITNKQADVAGKINDENKPSADSNPDSNLQTVSIRHERNRNEKPTVNDQESKVANCQNNSKPENDTFNSSNVSTDLSSRDSLETDDIIIPKETTANVSVNILSSTPNSTPKYEPSLPDIEYGMLIHPRNQSEQKPDERNISEKSNADVKSSDSLPSSDSSCQGTTSRTTSPSKGLPVVTSPSVIKRIISSRSVSSTHSSRRSTPSSSGRSTPVQGQQRVQLDDIEHAPHDRKISELIDHRHLARQLGRMSFYVGEPDEALWRSYINELNMAVEKLHLECISLCKPTGLHQIDGFLKIWNDLTHQEEVDVRSFTSEFGESNVSKNRYRDILPWDHTRVKLNTRENDYINASHIENLTPLSPRYIATQGPIPQCFEDFWTMVWEQRSSLIVMLTNEMESHRLKCHRYWSKVVGEAICYGNMEITLIEEAELAAWRARTFIVRNVKENDADERVIRHLQFTTWPDYGTPDSPFELLALCEEVHLFHEENDPSFAYPIILHCSAGVGRTGSFCCIYSAIREIQGQHGLIQIPGVVRKLRQCRPHMVQRKEQLIFCYQAIHCFAQQFVSSELEKLNRSAKSASLQSSMTSDDFLFTSATSQSFESHMNKPRCIDIENHRSIYNAGKDCFNGEQKMLPKILDTKDLLPNVSGKILEESDSNKSCGTDISFSLSTSMNSESSKENDLKESLVESTNDKSVNQKSSGQDGGTSNVNESSETIPTPAPTTMLDDIE